ncbi:MAG: FAD-binding oxidoreductase [Deinococcales bacterium]|nr:FAD-binding oxidoreductase [Chitinophagaceae bacterium]
MTYDYIIVGQGVAGTFLSWYLINTGKKVLVIDNPKPFTASKVASGVINPVTGRRIVRTWMIETLMPFAVDAYTAIGKQLGVSIISQKNILDFHPTPQMMLAFKERLPEESDYLRVPTNKAEYQQYFNITFGIGEINPCYLVDVTILLNQWRKFLLNQNALLEEVFDINQLITQNLEFITYKGFSASKIIFADGAVGADNSYFKLLPYAKNKGQAIIAEIPDLPRTNIFKQGITIVPWQNDLWWIGSTYEWDFKDLHPSVDFRNKVENQLQHWLKLPYKIVDHIAAERPANLERRPFVGLHPMYPNIGIFNGMGTKGCSLAPYFAKQFTNNLIDNSLINPFVNVQRFAKILSR